MQARPYLLEEEDTYEPPEDPDSGELHQLKLLIPIVDNIYNRVFLCEGLSLEELGMRALERIPRDKAIDGIHAFQEMRYDPVN